jgi:parallel beta-helix repeat protein
LISGSLLVGIALDGNANTNIIRGNLIGTDEAGNASPLTQGETGILIKAGAVNNIIGGNAQQRNVISGHDRSATSSGIHIEASAGITNKIVGNYIGTNKDGNARAGNSIGVLVDTGGVTIGGDASNPNVISGNINQGILVQGETSLLSGITISNNFIGTDGTGLVDAFVGNTVGVLIAQQVQDTTIKKNTISGNLTGVDISLGAKATVSQNFIGTGASGETALPNSIGIAVVQTTDCTIKDNIVSGNRIGILLGDGIGPDPDPGSPKSKNLGKFYALHSRPNGATVFTERITVQNNQIGTNLSGGSAVGNSFAGIAIGENARNNKIGGSISSNKGNVISGQTSDDGGYGIFIGTRTEDPVPEALPADNLVQGNRIGLKAAQDEALSNKVGVYLSKADNNFIGGGKADSTDTPNVANIIGGSVEDGVRAFGALTQNNVVVNNFIGVTPTGIDIGNEGNGVAVIDAPNNRVGVVLNDNNEAGSSNVIAANHLNGILIEGSAAINTNIFGNAIGIVRLPTETVAMGNLDNGIKLLNVGNTSIGGTSPERRNVIGGNFAAGILITGSGASFNSVKNNVIGTDEVNTPNLGNGGDGVLINDQAGNNTIGGLEPNSGNIITGNAGSGVRLADDAGCCNVVDPNSIYGNSALGIDIGPGGTTGNDPGDPDGGANRLQNYPEFSGAVIDQNGNLLLQYKVDSDPANANYGGNGLYIEFFKADASLQGETFVGSSHYTVADYDNGAPGDVSFNAGNASSHGVAAGDRIVATATDADGNTSEFTSVNVGVVGNPTAVKLAGFTATAHENSVLLNWKTGFEVDNLGFNVYREVDGTRNRITPQLIAGSALSDGPGTSLLSGHSYYWADTPPVGNAVRYWLEDIDLSGKSTYNGPYSITTASARSAEEAQRRSELISQIGVRQGVLENGLGSAPLLRLAPVATVTADGLQWQHDLATKPAVKIGVKAEGVYRLTQPELLAAGLDPKVDPRRLQLFVDGVEQTIKVTGEQDGRFDAGDTVEFFGVGLDVASTDSRVYWLVAGARSGKRMTPARVKGGQESPGGFPFTVERKDRTIYFSALRNGDAENFFGTVVASQPVDQSLWVQHLDQTSHDPASIDVSLQGVTKLSHNVRVQVNGTDVTRLSFIGQSQGRKLASIPQSLLREGENHVRLIAEGGPGDVSLVDRIRISYSHSFVADGDLLRVTAQSGQRVQVSGFTRRDIRLLDVTDINAPEELAATVTADKNGYTVSGSAAGSGDRALLAFAESQVDRPATITANQPSSLRHPTNSADMLIVTRREFISAVEPLKTLRQSQGLSVSVVDIEDIYDEFSFGHKSPQAMRDFIAHAAANWQKKPRFVLFGGDASYDPRNYLGYGDADVVPTKLLDTAYMETASDDWFSDFDEDGVAGLATGRLPARNAEQMRSLIDRLVGYESGEAGEEVMLVSDANDGFDFEAASAQLQGLLPADLRVTQVNRGRVDEETAKRALLDGIHRKQRIVNYVGHGSVSQWRGNLLTGEDAVRLANSHRPVFVMMTCLNGYFQDAGTESLGEALLNAQNGGAIAVWASSAMTLPGYQATMNQAFYRALFGGSGGSLSLGEAIGRAKASVSDADVRRTWVLLGDPSMRLK